MTVLERKPKLDAREWVYREALKSLVGPAAELRAESGSPGWRRFVTEEEKYAVHEAAHAIFGHALLKYRVSEITLDPPAIKVRRGVLKACCIFDARISLWNRIIRWFRGTPDQEPEPLEHDQRRALRYCILLCPEPVS